MRPVIAIIDTPLAARRVAVKVVDTACSPIGSLPSLSSIQTPQLPTHIWVATTHVTTSYCQATRRSCTGVRPSTAHGHQPDRRTPCTTSRPQRQELKQQKWYLEHSTTQSMQYFSDCMAVRNSRVGQQRNGRVGLVTVWRPNSDRPRAAPWSYSYDIHEFHSSLYHKPVFIFLF